MKARYRRYLIRAGLILAALAALLVPYFKMPATLTYDAGKSMVLVPGSLATIGGSYVGDFDETTAFSQEMKPFWLGVREVSQADFNLFLGSLGEKPNGEADQGDLPASGLDWYQAIRYCNWLSAQQSLKAVYAIQGTRVTADWTADGYRLPSEAEWEYAMRGGPYGNNRLYPGSGNALEVAHFRDNSTDRNPRGKLKPNELGLYDMAGNVAEWVWDSYGMFPAGTQSDYHGADISDFRVIRGGAYDDSDYDMRVTDRNYLEPAAAEPTVGLRLARNATGEFARMRVVAATAIPLPNPPADAAYKDATRPVAERVKDLLGRMSLDEKIGQMTQIASEFLNTNDLIVDNHLGSLLTGGDWQPNEGTAADWAEAMRGYQQSALTSRLGIPILYGIDSVHGAAKVRNATIFPHNIGLGAANDPVLMEKMGQVVAAEMRASGLTWNFAPCLAVSQDERWGRTYESFSEDPAIVGRLGAAYIRGLQGSKFGPGSIVATAKHYVADGGTLGGVDRGNAVMPEEQLRRIHLAPYVEAVKAGAAAVMVSFSSWNDLQMHANKRLVTEWLRGELGFKGVVISDWGAQKLLPGKSSQQIKAMVDAGVDVCMVPDHIGRNGYIDNLRNLVIGGELSQTRIDEAVTHILTLKFTLGLFEKPYGDRSLIGAVGSAAHRAVARALAAKSVVVLKNDRVLPLRQKQIWITGPLANDSIAQCGGWTMGWQGAPQAVAGVTTLQSAIIARAKSKGSSVLPIGRDAQNTGAKPDLVIYVTGEAPYAEFEGDSQNLNLSIGDRESIQAFKKKGIPVLLLLVSGRPLMVRDLLPSLDGLVAVWLPGSEGAGVADVLFGDVKASGRLSMSWPTDNAQIPVNPGDGKTPLFPLGFGLDL